MSDTFDEGEGDATGLEQQMIDQAETNQAVSPEEDLGNKEKTQRGTLEGTLANNSLQDGTATSFIVSKELKSTQRGLQRAKYKLNMSCWTISQVSTTRTTSGAKYCRTAGGF